MSDILIKNMEMPKACGDCPFFKRGANPMGEDFIFAQPWGDCLVSGEENVIEHDISMDCPLIPVPEHGRLGDLDELYRVVDSMNKCSMSEVIVHILDAPTVLEANK